MLSTKQIVGPWAVWFATACLLMLVPALPDAQQAIGSATVSGTVFDPTDAVVSGATVALRNHDTNQVVQTTTDGRGQFRLLYVPVGLYHLSVFAKGFVTTNVNLSLGIGQALDVPVKLTSAAAEESVSIVGQAPLVETGRTDVASAITPQEVDGLPLNGRNYLDLATLAPNVSRTNLRSTDRFAETSAVPGTGISVAGQRNLSNGFIIDGLSANDDAADLAGTFLSEDVVREFQVITSGGVAEFGRSSSGTINVVTQSGTDSTSGRLYEFLRDDLFDARNPLSTRRDPTTGASLKDPLRQNQYGFSLGGPLIKDRTFWFGNVERTEQDRTGVVTILPASASAINSVLDSVGYRADRVTTGDFSTGYHTTNIFGRVDHQTTNGSRLQVRYSLYDVSSQNARNVTGLTAVSRGTALDDRDQTIAANYLTMFSSGIVHEARGQWTRSRLSAPVNDIVGPAVNISGVASWGTATSSPTARDLDVFEGVDAFTLQRGAHLFKTGADVLYDRVDIAFPGALQGVYTFTSLANFERGLYSTFQQAFGAVSQFQSNPNLGVFAQDEWRPRPGLTINGGLRYDLQWLPDPIAIDANNVSPRVGVAYAPGDGRTVVRASGGIYFDRIPLRATSNALQRDGSQYQTAVLAFGQAGAPLFPSVLPAFPSSVLVSITRINRNIHEGYSRQANVEFERAFGATLSATVGYSYLRGRGIIMSSNVNVPTLTVQQANALGVANLGRPNPDFGNISQYDAIGDSWFNGLTMSLLTRSAPWGRARVAYTLSKSLDDAGNAFFQTPQDNFNILGDKGPSDNDQRHRLVLSGTFGDGTSVAIRRAFGGIQIGYVFSYSNAAPFNPQAGVDLNNDTTINDRPIGVGRNSARMPCWAANDRAIECGTSSFDLRLSRAVTFNNHHRVEVMAEGFNLFNRTNVVNVNATFGTGTTPSSAYKQITAVGDKRQIQLGARWSF